METRRSIWVLEDDLDSQFVYKDILQHSYDLQFYSNVAAFRQALSAADTLPDLVIADLRLPGESFIDYCKESQDKSIGFRALVVSSVDDAEVVRYCFQKGVMDYLTKPFGKAELVIKIERLFEKSVSAGAATNGHALQLDPTTLSLKYSHSDVRLTAKEFQIMSLLTSAADKPISRDELVRQVWENVRVEKKTLDVHLTALRKKLSSIGIRLEFIAPDSYQIHLKK